MEDMIKKGVHGCSKEESYVEPKDPLVRERLEWFRDQKLALMMHFGPYSQMGHCSWPLSDKDASWSRAFVDWESDAEVFCQQYVDLNKSFNPYRMNPDKWAEFAAENNKTVPVFTPEAMSKLTNYDFPGNIRELRNCVERLIVFNSSPEITVEDLPDYIRKPVRNSQEIKLLPNNEPEQLSSVNINEQQHDLIIKVLHECGNNRTSAAEKLGISRRTLQRRLKEYGINE